MIHEHDRVVRVTQERVREHVLAESNARLLARCAELEREVAALRAVKSVRSLCNVDGCNEMAAFSTATGLRCATHLSSDGPPTFADIRGG